MKNSFIPGIRFCQGLSGLFALIFCLSVLVLTGCATLPTLEQAGDRVAEADKHFEVVKGLEVQTDYPDLFSSAKKQLEDAKKYLKKRSRKKAFNLSESSILSSRTILKRYYRDTVSALAMKVKTQLQKKVGQDPDNPLKDEIPKLDAVLAFANAFDEEGNLVSISKVLSDLDEIINISQKVSTHLTEVLHSDITFSLGRYDLSERGKNSLRAVLKTRISGLVFPANKVVRLQIRVVGFTDSLSFGRNSALVKRLSKGIETDVPPKNPERRRFLNKRLSEHRAKTIADFISAHISEYLQAGTYKLRIDTEIQGRGEEIPSSVKPPYPIPDSRRRICKIYINASGH
ncbi:hypothetical protein QUF76_03085 [Desulfobacterales bacterium HSG16]|nr:hypothetical protein [Desulfobacterales bacterium HSG16]